MLPEHMEYCPAVLHSIPSPRGNHRATRSLSGPPNLPYSPPLSHQLDAPRALRKRYRVYSDTLLLYRTCYAAPSVLAQWPVRALGTMTHTGVLILLQYHDALGHHVPEGVTEVYITSGANTCHNEQDSEKQTHSFNNCKT